MKINIAASHRFHLLDLARELSNLGHDVRFYSYVPTRRAVKFGLKPECSHSLVVLMLPFLVFIKLSKNAYWAIKLSHLVLDYCLSWFMRPCDIYIALGTVYKKSFVSAKNRFGATTIVEWGSKHIQEQQRILSQIPDVRKQPEYFTNRSLFGYDFADYIAIPSDHVKRSFIDKGVSAEKLLQNPYGVDLSMFKATELVSNNVYDLIIVGAWSYRKGCDLLIQACQKNNFRLLHVGALLDIDFPNEKNFKHIDSVDQCKLINYYSQARVFILPSREEGLAMVQLQALMCGLPIVCSMHTGGRDLQNFLNEKKWVCELKEYTVAELERCIFEALELASTQTGFRSYANDVSEQFSWEAYGRRYSENLIRLCKHPIISCS